MFVRTSLTGVLAASLAASTLVLSAGAAHAAYTPDPDDTNFTPVATDIIGVGSDTSQNAMLRISEAYNSTSPAPANKMASYAATGGGQIPVPSGGEINRPNGSGSGKGLLYGANENTDVDYARSSSAQNSAETAAGLQSFPFALDTLKLAVSNTVASNAPLAITPAQMVDIYDGTTTNWNQLGGSAGVIKPLIPQAGSGTRSFFVSQLNAANGGAAVTLAASVQEVQEHDPAPIQNDPNAVAPFSQGRAGLAGTALRLEGGFSADRALYNVVRASDVGDAELLAILGEEGFVCSAAARPAIEAAGFEQLATPENDGVCGAPTQAASSNFTVSSDAEPEPVVTTTTLDATSPSAGALRLVAAVSGSPTPTGTVTFVDDRSGSTLGTVSLSGGTATLNLTGTPAGTYTVTADYAPTAGSDFVASSGSDTVTVAGPAPSKTTSKLSENFKKAYQGKAAKKMRGVVTVRLAGTSQAATGKIVVKEGSKTVATGTLSNGKAAITLTKKKLGKGVSKLVASWKGNSVATGSKLSFSVKVK